MIVAQMAGCVGCPMYQDGSQGFCPDEINAPEGVFAIVAQNPGADEEHEGRPLVGKTGQMMERVFLPVTGFTRQETNLLNVLKCRWQRSNTMPPAAILKPAVKHCMEQHFRLPTSTRAGIAMGGPAWKAMTDLDGITDWRGHVVERGGVKWLASLHLADLFRDPRMHHVTIADWKKTKAVVKGTYPRPLPKCTVNDLAWFHRAMEAPYVVVDGEWDRTTRVLYLLGLGHPRVGYTQVGAGLDDDRFARAYADLVSHVPVVFHNALADIPVVHSRWGVAYADYRAIDDSMLLHAVLHSEWPHTLEFCMSVYGQYEKSKQLHDTDRRAYNLGDLVGTVDTWEALRAEVAFDPRTEDVYRTQSLPLIPVLLKAMYV